MNTQAKSKAENEVEQPKVKHPLIGSELRVLDSFENWLTKWKQSTHLHEKLGLLHALTSNNGWRSGEDQLVFTLLDIADGFTSSSNFGSDGPGGCDRQTVENRQEVAKKAFSVLCLRFFDSESSRDREDRDPSWLWMLAYEVLFGKLLWFLRFEGDTRTNMHNRISAHQVDGESEKHYYTIFREFMFNFAKLGWHLVSGVRGWNEKTHQLVNQRLMVARPQFVDILDLLGELNWLGSKHRSFKLDEATIKILTEKVLCQKLYLSKKGSEWDDEFRNPESLEEALLPYSVAAEIVLIHNIRAREAKRIAALVEQARQRSQEKYKADLLAEIEKEKKELEKKERDLKDAGKK